MSEKRRDSKNRIHRTVESQEADGRNKYRYIDANGKRKSVYSWRSVATDSIPAGVKHTTRAGYGTAINPQYLMEHSDISVTLNTYTHLMVDYPREEVEMLVKKQAEADAELKQLDMKEDLHQVIKLGKSG